MKLDKKGYMLVEIIVSFSIAITIFIYLLNLTIKFKNLNEDIHMQQLYTSTSTYITENIMEDLNKMTVTGIEEVEGVFYIDGIEVDDEKKEKSTRKKLSYNNNVIEYCEVDNNNCIKNKSSYFKKEIDLMLNLEDIDFSIDGDYLSGVISLSNIYSDDKYDAKILVNKGKLKTISDVPLNEISNNNVYIKVGDTKCIALDGFTTTNDNGCDNGEFLIRVANTSSPEECSSEGFSQSACGLVFEFADVITTHNMNPSGTYTGTNPSFTGQTYDYGWNMDGWPGSSGREYLSTTIYDALPNDVKSAIIDTFTVSGHGNSDTGNLSDGNWGTTDKLYLLAPHEIWEDGTSNLVSTIDTAYTKTRQLDYYNNLGVTTNSYSSAIKNRNGSTCYWWLRGVNSSVYDQFVNVYDNGDWSNTGSNEEYGLLPAFRIAT